MRSSSKLIAYAAAIVVVLNIMNAALQWKILFYLLFCGMAVHLLITGGHGGTHLQEAFGIISSFVVNTVVYAIGVFALSIWRRH
jgi:hypothetical protein